MPDPIPLPINAKKAEEVRNLAKAFARTFSTDDGALVMEHLRRLTKERVHGPRAGDAALWHLEGQRWLVNYVEVLIKNGNKDG